jgi:hypothetical protein
MGTEGTRRCFLCDNPATWHVHGYFEDGWDSNFGYTPVCVRRKREFEARSVGQPEEWFPGRHEEVYFHGYSYLTDIHPIGARCSSD